MPQCAALSTHLSLRRVPPQNMLAYDVDEELERPTCHPTSPMLAFWPPTTLVEFRSLLRVSLPQMHLEVKYQLSWMINESKRVCHVEQDGLATLIHDPAT